MGCDRISLGRIHFREIVVHGLDEAASYFGSKVERLADYHVRSDSRGCGANLFATASAANSSVSRAIF